MEVECPTCGETCRPQEIEQKRDEELPVKVARRQSGFSGDIVSLLEMNNTAYMAELPCGHEFLTVN